MSNRIADIEMLRGFAVLFVVIHHANGALFTWSSSAMSLFYSYFCGGVGVDLFFAISGFVIARDLIPRLRESQGSQVAIAITLAFWVRRAWRLWPSAWLWLAPTPLGPDENMFWPMLIMASALILLLSDLNYRFIEIPLRARGVTLANKILKKTL